MLTSKTVFVLGAGASKEVRMPLGSELRDEISRCLHMQFEEFGKFVGDGDHRILAILKKQNSQDYFRACGLINRGIGLSASIDDFIDLHRADTAIAACGKLAIAACILESENRSSLYVEPGNIYNTVNFNIIKNTWYVEFLRLISNRVPKEQLDTLFSNVSIISFNYDRCIEHFLIHALAAQYGMELDEVRPIVDTMKVFRPYGSVGELAKVPFGSKQLPPFENATTSLRTYTEQVADEKELKAMQNLVAEAQTLVFLGSAFHANNMELLKPLNRAPKRIFATRAGISNADLANVASALNRLRKVHGGMINEGLYYSETCHSLFDEHKLGLRAA